MTLGVACVAVVAVVVVVFCKINLLEGVARREERAVRQALAARRQQVALRFRALVLDQVAHRACAENVVLDGATS